MAYESNDIQDVLGTIKLGNCSELRVTKVSEENGDFKAIDIRNWYCTSSNPEMKPTQKGVRIKKEHLAEVLALILENVDEDVDEQLAEKGFGN